MKLVKRKKRGWGKIWGTDTKFLNQKRFFWGTAETSKKSVRTSRRASGGKSEKRPAKAKYSLGLAGAPGEKFEVLGGKPHRAFLRGA